VFPLNLYAHVRFCFVILAHETAGAARTRSSLRPFWDRTAPSRFWGPMLMEITRADSAAGTRICGFLSGDLIGRQTACACPGEGGFKLPESGLVAPNLGMTRKPSRRATRLLPRIAAVTGTAV
jgi:hypothetical protein